MEHDFWFERWKNQQLGFHLDQPNRHLVEHGGLLADGPTRVLVPLAGKSRDLTWLRAAGHEVVGVEFVEQAGIAFFEENGLDPAASRIGPHPVFRADGITMVLDDFFALDPATLGRFGAIYDRAALVAIDPARRPAYVQKLRALASDDARLLLVSFDHDIGTGPPFSLAFAELQTLMAGLFTLEPLADLDLLPSEPRFRERGAKRVREQVWLGRAVAARR